jgi:hypothetical protein
LVFECLSPVNENYRHFVAEFLQQLRVGIDIHFVPPELSIALDLYKRVLDYLAEMTSFARIDDYLVHKGYPYPTIVPIGKRLGVVPLN